MELIQQRAAYEYFFNNLNSPDWILPLEERGFFSEPPQPEAEDGMIWFPPWPESQYLARVAAEDPEGVTKISLAIPTEGNARVQADLIDAALQMPVELASQLASRVANWLETPYLMLPPRAAAYISHLALGSAFEAALEVTRELLAVQPGRHWVGGSEAAEDPNWKPEPVPRVQVWEIEQFARDNLPDLIRSAPRETLELVGEKLSELLLLRRADGESHFYDYSEIWRPSISPHPQNWRHGDFKDILVSATRDAAVEAVEQNPAILPEVIAELEGRKWTVFRRIALHVLDTHADQDTQLLDSRITDHDVFTDASLRHEYSAMLQAHFGGRPRTVQETVFAHIEEGPDLSKYIERISASEDRYPDDDELQNIGEHWQLDWLEILKDFLPEDLSKKREALGAEYGIPPHPDLVSVSSEPMVGPTSPIAPDQIREMTISGLIKYLEEWEPGEGFMVDSRDGLSRALAEVVELEPSRFADNANDLTGLDPTYTRGIIDGFRTASEKGTEFGWEPVLELCLWVVSQSRDELFHENRPGAGDPHWGWARKEIAKLLEDGFKPKGNGIPFSLKELAWQVLEPITGDPDPSKDQEDGFSGTNMDAAALSINATRGAAFHAAFRYLTWCDSNLRQLATKGDDNQSGLDKVPEVRALIDRHLDISHESSLAVRSVYGMWTPSLILMDREWVLANLDKIFPTDDELQLYWEAAWHAVIRFNQPRRWVLETLQDEYVRALGNLGESETSGSSLSNPDERLAEHISIYYWQGDLESESEIFQRFWESAPSQLRGHAMSFIGRTLHNMLEAISQDAAQRLANLWEHRLASATGHETVDPFSNEMKAFGWWFASGKLDDEWSITQLNDVLRLIGEVDVSHLVVGRLDEIATAYPMEVVKLLAALVEGDKKGWGPHMWRDSAMSLLGNVLVSSNAEASRIAEDIINRLGARGYLEYGSLLQEE